MFLQRDARSFEARAGGSASLDERNRQKAIGLDDATVEGILFSAIMPIEYLTGSNATLVVRGRSASATTGNTRLRISFESQPQDSDADSFATALSGNAAADATSGIEFSASFTISNATLDGAAPGSSFRLKIERVGDDGTNDTMTGDFQLRSWYLSQ